MLNYFFQRHSKSCRLQIALSLEGWGSVAVVHSGKSNILAVVQTKWHPRKGLYFLTSYFFLQAFKKSCFVRLKDFTDLIDCQATFPFFFGPLKAQ